MQRFLIGIARFTLSAWVGAAVLFVVVGIQEVRSPDFDSVTRDVLVALRFPSYYGFGFTLVAIALLAVILTFVICKTHKRRYACLAGGLCLVLAMMAVDYFWIYVPLLEMVTPPGKPRLAEFVDYHNASKWINFASLALCAVVAWILCVTEQPKANL